MNWLETYPEVSAAVVGAACVAVGYIYRARTERRENLKDALYLLLEIWHRLSILTAQSPEKLFGSLAERFHVLYPDLPFSKDQLEASKAHFIPILQRTLIATALDDFNDLQTAFKTAVQLVARSNPVYAYRIESVSSTRKRLSHIAQYLEEAFGPLEAEGGEAVNVSKKVKQCINELVQGDATKDMEEDLRGLALRISVCTYIDVILVMKRRRKLLLKGPDVDRFDEVIKKIVSELQKPN